jgi:hypothetical protein
MKDVSQELSVEDVFRLIRLAEGLEDGLKWSTAPRVRFEVSFLRWVTLDRTATIREILDKLGSDGSTSSGTRTSTSAPAPATTPKPTPRRALESIVKPPVPTPLTAVTQPASLDDFQMLWPEIVKALAKMNPAAGAQAQAQWELEAFDGRKLTVRCTKPGAFHEEQMKKSFQLLTDVIHGLTGLQVVPVAAEETVPHVRPASASSPAPAPPAVSTRSNDDLFNNFMSRVDGLEIDPKTLNNRKGSTRRTE